MTWLIGMKLSVIDGQRRPAVVPVDLRARRHMLATMRSGYIAPLGAPVLPDV